MSLFYLSKLLSNFKKFEQHTATQKEGVKRFKDVLRLCSDDTGELREVDFFFYCDKKEKINALTGSLEILGYDVHSSKNGHDEKFCVSGTTPPMNLEEKSFVLWVEKMNEIAFVHDCEFDGWGTLA